MSPSDGTFRKKENRDVEMGPATVTAQPDGKDVPPPEATLVIKDRPHYRINASPNMILGDVERR
jgi:hypothetical protein